MRVEHIGHEVFAFDLFSERQCADLLEQVDELPISPPNSMNKYGKTLRGRRLTALVAELVVKHVTPIVRSSYMEIAQLRLAPLKKHPYAFVVDYSPKTQRSLAWHHDTSDVTLNVCLGRDFAGGDLQFFTRSGDKKFIVKQIVGRAIVHRGSHGHRALPLVAGARTNLILWCDAKGGRR
jgi:hypothetical protein